MTENKLATDTNWVDPDDAPELDDDWFDRAELRIGRRIIRKGHPPGATKTQIALRVDNDVLAAFRAEGPGWQSRMNDALRKAAGL